jgi:hypothetical protein
VLQERATDSLMAMQAALANAVEAIKPYQAWSFQGIRSDVTKIIEATEGQARAVSEIDGQLDHLKESIVAKIIESSKIEAEEVMGIRTQLTQQQNSLGALRSSLNFGLFLMFSALMLVVWVVLSK